MKKHLSVLTLYLRGSLFPALAVMVVTLGVMAVRFCTLLDVRAADVRSRDSVLGLEYLFSDTGIPLIAAVALLVLTVLLIIPGTGFGSETAYTFARLRISEKSAFFWQAGYNAAVFFLFWMAQAALLYTLCLHFAAVAPGVTEQTFFLGLYRDEFLHSILPLHEASRFVRNLSYCLVLGVAAAYCTATQRQGKIGWAVLPVLVVVIRSFPDEMGALPADIIWTLVALFSAAMIIFGVCMANYIEEEA